MLARESRYVSIRQHTYAVRQAYVSIRQVLCHVRHTSAYVRYSVTEGTLYFERHSDFEGGKHSAQLIGIVEVEPAPVTMTVDSPFMADLWSIWSTNDPTLAAAAMQHMCTKPSPHSVLTRVQRDNKDPIYMYKIVCSVILEAYALTVQFQRGAMGYIPAGVLSIKRKQDVESQRG